jgi:hypothetical protein
MDRVGKALDHKYLSRAGNLSFLVGIALFVYGKIADASLEVWILVLLVAGVLFMALPYMGRLFERWAGRSKSTARKAVEVPQPKAAPERKPNVVKKQKSAPKPASSNYRYLRTRLRRAKAAFETELVVLIDEWKLVRNDHIRGTDYGTYSLWERKTSSFLASVLGETERSRFQSNKGESNPSLHRQAELRILALEDLRDNPARWSLGVKSRDDIRAAIEERRDLAPRDRIVLAGTPDLAKLYNIPLREDEPAPVSDPHPEADPEPPPSIQVLDDEDSEAAETDEEDGRQPTLRPGMGTLEKLYVEGRRMQKAAAPFAGLMGGLLSPGPPPTEAQIDRWQGKVRAALPPAHRRRFTFAPLEAKVNEPFTLGGITLSAFAESEQAKRLRTSLEELQRIMDEMT